MHAVDWLCAVLPRHMFWLERDLYLIPPPQDTEHAAQLPHLFQHDDGQFVHVVLHICPRVPGLAQGEVCTRIRALVPLVVQVPWQDP